MWPIEGDRLIAADRMVRPHTTWSVKMSYPNSGEDPYGGQYGGGQYGGGQYGGGFGGPPGPPPENNLVWAILSTLFCCLPLGIVSIVKAANVNSLWAAGQFQQAQQASQDARKFALWAAIAGVVLGVIYFAFVMVAAAGSM